MWDDAGRSFLLIQHYYNIIQAGPEFMAIMASHEAFPPLGRQLYRRGSHPSFPIPGDVY